MTNDLFDVPATSVELRTTVRDDSTVLLAQVESPVPAPGPDEVVVRIEAAPLNPSDLGLLFAMGDPESAVAADGESPGVVLTLARGAFAASRARLNESLTCGNEGAGKVVAAGSSDQAQAMLGKIVSFLSRSSYAQYRTLNVASCLVMGDGVSAEQAASAFINPLTALGMVETMRAEGHTAIIHTVGASNLGRMLARVCRADDIPLVNLVRRPEQAEALRASGDEFVCVTTDDDFFKQLVNALRSTGATIAFDAIGGGELAGTILSAMERVASEGSGFSIYGSDSPKQVYIYGGLDRGPTVLPRNHGLTWSVGGWLLTPFLMNLGPGDYDRLRTRVRDEITTTFASGYGEQLSLDQVVDPEVVRRYTAMSTGAKALLRPQT